MPIWPMCCGNGIDWPQTWAMVQAIGSVAVFLTLIAMVRQQQTMSEQLHTSRDQVREAITTREASFQPHVHARDAEFNPPYEASGSEVRPDLEGGWVGLSIANVGAGPALSLRAQAVHPWLIFEPGTGYKRMATGTNGAPLLLEPGDDEWSLMFTLDRLGARQMDLQDARIRLEYRDLGGRWWATTTLVRFAYRYGADGFSDVGATVVDQEERVERITGPSIPAQPPRPVDYAD